MFVGVYQPQLCLVAVMAAALAARAGRFRTVVVLGFVMVGTMSGLLLVDRTETVRSVELPQGPIQITVEVMDPGTSTRWGGSVVVRPVAISIADEVASWNGPVGRLNGSGLDEWERGQRWIVETTMRSVRQPRLLDRVVWNGSTSWVEPIEGDGSFVRTARNYLLSGIDPEQSPGRALLAGFLLGDITALSDVEIEHMRRAGLSHFVAVSGSNVALFLALLFIMVGSFVGSRGRAIVGLLGLVFFVALVGPDPSVVRACVMASILLVARTIGLRPDVWVLIGGGVTALLLVSPELAFSLGFQLSVAATAGVVAGSSLFRGVRPRWLGSTLGASVGAQVTVAPVLLMTVGSVPLWAPVSNVVAAPLVAVATALGGVGALTGIDQIVASAAVLSNMVLEIAATAAPLPQLGAVAVGVVLLWASLLHFSRFRPALALVGSIGLIVSAVPVVSTTDGPAFVALDIGQGDALLVLGAEGETIMVDGGGSGTEALAALSRHGIDRIDLLVVTHAHLDHFGGLTEVVRSVEVRQLWHVESVDQADGYSAFLEIAQQYVHPETPGIGTYKLGTVELEVLGPIRRYASVNDQSLVLRVTVNDTTILLTGDIERFAQQDLLPERVDILKVPHHGAPTSDAEWLVATGAATAVVSVGENSFGHPSETLLGELVAAGMQVARTDISGDVVIPLG